MLSSSSAHNHLSLELAKPLGLILEAVQGNKAMGVEVEGLSKVGSAYKSEHHNDLVGLEVVQVMGKTVANLMFDYAMECIMNTPSPVTVSFKVVNDDVISSKARYEVVSAWLSLSSG